MFKMSLIDEFVNDVDYHYQLARRLYIDNESDYHYQLVRRLYIDNESDYHYAHNKELRYSYISI